MRIEFLNGSISYESILLVTGWMSFFLLLNKLNDRISYALTGIFIISQSIIPAILYRIIFGRYYELGFYGAPVISLFFLFIFIMRYRGANKSIIDCVAFAWCFSQCWFDLADFTSGRSYGKTTTLPFGIAFHQEYGVSSKRHPVQLYNALLALLSAILLLSLSRFHKLNGSHLLIASAMLSLSRFATGFLSSHAVIYVMDGELTLMQITYISIFSFCMSCLFFNNRESTEHS